MADTALLAIVFGKDGLYRAMLSIECMCPSIPLPSSSCQRPMKAPTPKITKVPSQDRTHNDGQVLAPRLSARPSGGD